MEVMFYYAKLYPVDCPMDRCGKGEYALVISAAAAKKCCQPSAEKDVMKNDLARSPGKFRGTERKENI